MKKLLILFVFVILTSCIFPQYSGYGLGLRIGEPTGFTGKFWINDRNALSFNLGFALVTSHEQLNLSADYLYHNYDLIDIPENRNSVPFFYGFGVRIITRQSRETMFGARGVAGVAWYLKNVPVDIFIELAPVFNLFPSTALDLDAGIGARYYFH